MAVLFLVNEADNFHSLNSFRLVGIATTRKNAIKLINEALIDSEFGEKLPKNLVEQIERNNQTQQGIFDWEYNIQEVLPNTLT